MYIIIFFGLSQYDLPAAGLTPELINMTRPINLSVHRSSFIPVNMIMEYIIREYQVHMHDSVSVENDDICE